MFIHKKDTSYSASDGGFYYYSGDYELKKDRAIIKLIEYQCDYCGELVEKQKDGTYKRIYRTKVLNAIKNKKGLLIDGILYKRKKREELSN